MDFFTAQDEARKKTGWLLGLFLLCVVGVVVGVSLLSWGVSVLAFGVKDGAFLVAGAAAVFTPALIFVSSGFKAMQLRGGGGVVAKDLGGRLVDPSTTETSERKLLNVVEEMAIASGVPVPQVYVMDNEEGINAFAAGTEPGNAAIGVTRGCMMRLSRSELQGVIAHEFSHILNGDMKLNMRLIGWIFGLVVLSIMGRGLLESLRFVRIGGGGDRNENNGGGAILLAIMAVGVGLLILGGIGVFFARVLQAAVSRQREYLADASAVQFTREPDGLANALKKIGGKGSQIESAKASEASHCFFADGGLFAFGLATHPPLDVRIKRIQKEWDGKFTKSQLPPIGARGPARNSGDARVSGLAAGSAEGLRVEEGLSSPERVDVARGIAIREELPEAWRQAVHERGEAQALVFGLLLAQDQEVRVGEVEYLRESAGEAAAELALTWQGELGALHSSRKIALLDLTIPTLRNLSREEYRRFVAITQHLIESDGQVDLFEYMLQRLIAHHLEGHFGRRSLAKIRYHRVADLGPEVALFASAFANLSPNPKEAFAAAQAALSHPGELVSSARISLTAINAALEKLEVASPLVKKQVLEACAQSVGSDGDLSNREAELLRAMADGIGCAIPPWVGKLEKVA